MNNFQKESAFGLGTLAKWVEGYKTSKVALSNALKYGTRDPKITGKTILGRAGKTIMETAFDTAGNPELMGKTINQGVEMSKPLLDAVQAKKAKEALRKGLVYGVGGGALVGGALAFKAGRKSGAQAAMQQAFSPYAVEKTAELLKKKDSSVAKEAAFNLGEYAGNLLKGTQKGVTEKLGLMGKTMFNSNALVKSKALAGAGVGAGVGAVTGLASGDDAKGIMGKALGGAALGAGAGAGYGKYLGKQYQRKAWMTAGAAAATGAAGYGVKKFMGTEAGQKVVSKVVNSDLGQKVMGSDALAWAKGQAGELKNTFNTVKSKTGNIMAAGAETLNSAKDKLSYVAKRKLGLNVDPNAGLEGKQLKKFVKDRAKNIANIRKQRLAQQ